MEELILKVRTLSYEDLLKIREEVSKHLEGKITYINEISNIVESQGYTIRSENISFPRKICLYFNVYATKENGKISNIEAFDIQPEWVSHFPIVLSDLIENYGPHGIEDKVQIPEGTPTLSKYQGRLLIYLYYRQAKTYPISKVIFSAITSSGEIRNFYIIEGQVYTAENDLFDTVSQPEKLDTIYILEE